MGLVRQTNEDFCLFNRDRRLIIIADGVGGYDYGEVASRLAAESAYALIENQYSDNYELENEDPIKLLNDSIVFANKKIIDMKVQRPTHQRMGTTLTCLYFDKQFVYFSYIGDSRVYHIDTEKQLINQLSVDHTLSKNKLDSKVFPRLHANANHVLTRMVGSGNSINPGFGKHPLKKSDLILACSDGLSDMVSDENILKSIMQNTKDFDTCLNDLLSQVYKAGAEDNVSIALASLV